MSLISEMQRDLTADEAADTSDPYYHASFLGWYFGACT